MRRGSAGSDRYERRRRRPTLGDWRSSLIDSPHLCPTPLDREFYSALVPRLARARVRDSFVLSSFDGASLKVGAGETLTVKLLEGAQIVNVFAFNCDDPDERLWMQTIVREGLFLTRFARLWGTMARYRPLLTVLEDTVATRPGPVPHGQHHPIFGGSGTPADWRAAGGAPHVRSTWEQFARLMEAHELPPSLLKENICLFQKSALDPATQRLLILPSDALAGDRVTFFSEIDLCILLALSPYLDGTRPPRAMPDPEPRPVAATVSERIADPLPWPYPGVPYPDLSPYIDEQGVPLSVGGERTE